MAFITKKRGEIDTSVIYMTPPELGAETGMAGNTVLWHIRKDTIDAIRCECDMTHSYIDPDNCRIFIGLVNAGIIRPKYTNKTEK